MKTCIDCQHFRIKIKPIFSKKFLARGTHVLDGWVIILSRALRRKHSQLRKSIYCRKSLLLTDQGEEKQYIEVPKNSEKLNTENCVEFLAAE